MHTVIVSGGNIQEDFALSFLREQPFQELIAVDRGLELLYSQGICPTRIVGDFDSVEQKVFCWYQEQTEIEIRKFDPVKDATDTQIALELALELGSTSITILGGMGSRLDHTLGNVQTMMLALIKKEEQYGSYVSLLPLTSVVEGVNLIGFKYPLTNHTFTSTGSAGFGVSNEIVAKVGRIELSTGVFILIEARD